MKRTGKPQECLLACQKCRKQQIPSLTSQACGSSILRSLLTPFCHFRTRVLAVVPHLPSSRMLTILVVLNAFKGPQPLRGLSKGPWVLLPLPTCAHPEKQQLSTSFPAPTHLHVTRLLSSTKILPISNRFFTWLCTQQKATCRSGAKITLPPFFSFTFWRPL